MLYWHLAEEINNFQFSTTNSVQKNCVDIALIFKNTVNFLEGYLTIIAYSIPRQALDIVFSFGRFSREQVLQRSAPAFWRLRTII